MIRNWGASNTFTFAIFRNKRKCTAHSIVTICRHGRSSKQSRVGWQVWGLYGFTEAGHRAWVCVHKNGGGKSKKKKAEPAWLLIVCPAVTPTRRFCNVYVCVTYNSPTVESFGRWPYMGGGFVVWAFSANQVASRRRRGGVAFSGESRLARRVGLSEGRDQPSRLVFENEWYASFVVDTAGRIFCVISTSNWIYAHSPAHHVSHHVKQEKKRSYSNATWVFIVLRDFSSDRCAPFLFRLPPESFKLSLRNTVF